MTTTGPPGGLRRAATPTGTKPAGPAAPSRLERVTADVTATARHASPPDQPTSTSTNSPEGGLSMVRTPPPATGHRT